MIKPNFMIVGVARCGTTSLYKYLNQHPEINFSRIKEPKFFSSLDLKLPQNGIADKTVFSKMITNKKDYYNSFVGLDNCKVIGEASSDYFYYHKNVIPKIKSELGDIKIIICLRDPVERSYSAYNNLLRDSRESLSFDEALLNENYRKFSNWDWMWYYKSASLYYNGLKHFHESFSNVKVVFFEDLTLKTESTLNSIFEFLEVNTNFKVDVTAKYSQSGKPRNKIISLLTSRKYFFIFWLRELFLKFVPRKILENIASKLFKKNKIKDDVLKDLKSQFLNDIILTEQLLDVKLDNWK